AVFGLRVGHVVRVRRRHLRADLLAPLLKNFGKDVGGVRPLNQVVSFARILAEIIELAAARFVELDVLVSAPPEGPSGTAALVAVVRVMPEEGAFTDGGGEGRILRGRKETRAVAGRWVRQAASVQD